MVLWFSKWIIELLFILLLIKLLQHFSVFVFAIYLIDFHLQKAVYNEYIQLDESRDKHTPVKPQLQSINSCGCSS